MTEAQALTNFLFGLPTGYFRFEVIAGRSAPERDAGPRQN
jgi:hypothetical protein